MRVVAQPQVPLGRQGGHVLHQPAGVVEQLLGAVAAQPVLQHLQVLGGVSGVGQRHLVGAPGALGALPVDLLRAGPPLGGAQHDHRPPGTLDLLGVQPGGPLLDVGDLVEHLIQQRGEPGVDRDGVLVVETGGEDVRMVAVPAHEVGELVLADAGQHRGVGDLVAVEVQDRQHDPVGLRVDELVGVPAGGQRAGLGLAVADDGDGEDKQVGVVERRAVGVGQRVAQLTALVDGAGHLGRHVGGDTPGEGELPEQPAQPLGVLGDVGVDLGVGPLEVAVGHRARPAVTRAGDVDRGLGAFPDHPVGVGGDEVQPRGGAPVAQQPRLDVVGVQRLAQQRVVQQVDLPDGQVVRGAPPRVDARDRGVVRALLAASAPGGRGSSCARHGSALSCVVAPPHMARWSTSPSPTSTPFSPPTLVLVCPSCRL